MNAIPFLLNFPLLWGVCIVLTHRKRTEEDSSPEFRESLIYAGLFFSLEVWLFTECLSFFRVLTATNLAGAYLISAVLSGCILVRYRQNLFSAWRTWKSRPSDRLIRRTVTAVCLLIVLPHLLLAVYSPPSSVDCMTYHLPRVSQWTENQNIEAYPSDEPRQICLPPLGDYFFLHWYLLTGNDYFVNTVQVGMMIGVFLAASLLARGFGLDSRTQLLSALFILLVPTLLCEASQAMADVSATFFFLAFLYFGLKSIRPSQDSSPLTSVMAVFFMGLSLSLGINTKMTVAVFSIPFCAWFGLRYLMHYRFKVVPVYLLLIFLFLLVNGPFFSRNYQLCGTLYGDVELHQLANNAEHGPKAILSNFLRLLGFQLMTPSMTLNYHLNVRIMEGIHNLLGMGWNNPNTTFLPWPMPCYHYHPTYFGGSITLRNSLAMFILMGCLVSSLFSVFFRRQKGDVAPEETMAGFHPPKGLSLYVILVFLGFLVFGALIRWSPFSPRLTMPGLVAFSPYCAFVIARLLRGRGTGILAALAVFAGLFLTVQIVYQSLAFSPRNAFVFEPDIPSKETVDQLQAGLETTGYKGRIRFKRDYQPSTGGKVLWLPNKLSEIEDTSKPLFERYLRHREIMYFMRLAPYVPDFFLIMESMEQLDARNVGYLVTPHLGAVEYPLWNHYKQKGKAIRLQWIHYPEYYKNAPNYRENFVPDIVIFDNFAHVLTLLKEYELGDIHTNFRQYSVVEILGKRGTASDGPQNVTGHSP